MSKNSYEIGETVEVNEFDDIDAHPEAWELATVEMVDPEDKSGLICYVRYASNKRTTWVYSDEIRHLPESSVSQASA